MDLLSWTNSASLELTWLTSTWSPRCTEGNDDETRIGDRGFSERDPLNYHLPSSPSDAAAAAHGREEAGRELRHTDQSSTSLTAAR